MTNIFQLEFCTPVMVVLSGFVAMLYLKTIKHLFISRCTQIDCCCIQCKRSVIDESDASHLAESTEKMELP